MKSKFYLGIAALALLTSCANEDEVKSPAAGAIEFGNLFVNNSTRAVDASLANLEDFKVYGFMGTPAGVVFDGEVVSKTAGVWTYGNLQYWTAGNNYWFSAVAPSTDANWQYTPTTVEAAEYNGGGTLAFDNAAANGEQDLLYAWSGKIVCDAPASMKKVGLTFDHQLSRVMFTFQNDLKNSNTTIVVKDVKINDAFAEGSIDLTKANAAWSTSKPTLALAFGDFGKNIAINTKGSTDTKYLIPANKGYNMTFTVEMYHGANLAGTFYHTVTMPVVDMQRGYSYNFVTKLNEKNINPEYELAPIEFDVTAVNGWENAADTDVTL